jgi:S-adenosylmethionine hydrolase
MGIEQLVRRSLPVPAIGDDGRVDGHIVAVDHFGNLITDIRLEDLDRRELADGASPIFIVAGRQVTGLCQAYAEGAPNQPLAIVGSRGVVEFAVNHGSASDILAAKVGDPVSAFPPEKGADGHKP